MPAKNSLKLYSENGYYHIYNRGVEKRTIFQDEQDHKVFLHFLKTYLSKPDQQKDREKDPLELAIRPRPLKNFFQEITLLGYVLIPNHFHLLIKQRSANGIEKFMRSLGTKYVQYFNRRYKRVGPLFQGVYKALLINTDEQLLHLSRYIHLNPIHGCDKESPCHERLTKSYSSYADYLGKRKTEWVHPEEILSFFKTAQRANPKDFLSYQSFVEDYHQPTEEILGNFTIEQD